MNKLYGTKFIEAVIVNYKNLHVKYSKPEFNCCKINPWETNYGEDIDVYVKKIARRWFLLRTNLDKLGKIIEIFRNEVREIEFDEIEWLYYNYENFLLRLSAILDQTSKLINEVYEFDIPERKCYWYNLEKKLKIVNKESALQVKNYHKYLEPLLKQRNEIAHNGDFESSEIKEIDKYFFQEIEKQFFGEKWFDDMNNIRCKKRILFADKLDEILSISNKHLCGIMDTIASEYIDKVKVTHPNKSYM